MPEGQHPTIAGRYRKEARLTQKTRAALLRTVSRHRHRAEITRNLQDSLRSPAISANDVHEIANSINDEWEIQRDGGSVQTTWLYATVNTDGNTPRTAFTPQVGSTALASTRAAGEAPLWAHYGEDLFAPDTAGSVTPYLPDGAIGMTLCGTPRVVRPTFRNLLPEHIPVTPINSFEIDVAGRERSEIEVLAQTFTAVNSPLPPGLRPGGTSRVTESISMPVSAARSGVEPKPHLNLLEIIPPLPSFPPFDPYALTQNEVSESTVPHAATPEPTDTVSGRTTATITDEVVDAITIKNFSRPSAIYNPYVKRVWQDLQGTDSTVSSSLGVADEPGPSRAVTGTIDRHVLDTSSDSTITNIKPSPIAMKMDLGMEDGDRMQRYSRRHGFVYGDTAEDEDRWDSGVDTPAEGDSLSGSKTTRVESGGLTVTENEGSLTTTAQGRPRVRDDGRSDARLHGRPGTRLDNSPAVQPSSHRMTQQANSVISDAPSNPSTHHDRAKGKGPARVLSRDGQSSDGLYFQPDGRNPRPLGLHSGPALEHQYLAHDGSIRPYDGLAHDAYSHTESLYPPTSRPRPQGPRNPSAPLSTPARRPEAHPYSTLAMPPRIQPNPSHTEAARSSESLGIQPDATYAEMLHAVRSPLDLAHYDADLSRDYDVPLLASDEPTAASWVPEPQQEDGGIRDGDDGNTRQSLWQIVFATSSTDWPGPAGRIARGGYEAGQSFEAFMKRFGKSFYDEMMR